MSQWPYGSDPTYANPNQTLPMPNPKQGVMPALVWTSDWTRIIWEQALLSPIGPSLLRANPPASYVFEYEWSSPVFDLRPELRSGTNSPKNGLPAWDKKARLYINVQGLTRQPAPYQLATRAPTAQLTATAQDYVNSVIFNQTAQPLTGSPNEPRGINSVVPVGAPVSVTSALMSPPEQRNTALLMFAPPGTALGNGDGYPVRYWRLALRFQYLVPEGGAPPTQAQLPQLSIQAAVY